ncbi:hypothetical protein [Actinomycetospora sp. TBRC 11914]|uniref:hypothetical protein n=1 Tax=Actinomycetospora sp. TBRC 11914 TaxID=2729387 RepID=UPI00145C3AB0|nr:hypothetical protein [Actinomycetospora sp. TBRC 11914]NMO93909.1 hypothetical protein [Actinomycetospora sp. TBRC 11914]
MEPLGGDRLDSIRKTYLGLRVVMVLLVVLLFVSVAIQVWLIGPGDCYRTSFSSYYYTPVRPVFVAALSAVGFCLVLYRGNTDLENVLLNFSGFLAVIVAFVPTQPGDEVCDLSNLPSTDEIFSASTNNVSALLVVAALAVVVNAVVFVRARLRERVSTVSVVASIVTALALVGGALIFLTSRERFQSAAHPTAAISLFVGIFLVVVLNAASSRGPGYARIYGGAAVGMPVAAVIAFLAGGEHWVFWVEFVLISSFAVFWAIQTYELRGYVARPDQPEGTWLGRPHPEGRAVAVSTS